jgi:DNA polymerase I-like protein with 3'-5' exonuclease and polymerase domains
VSRFTSITTPFIIRADPKVGGLRLAFDIEADGLVAEATKTHCIVVADLDSDQVDEYGPKRIAAALKHLARADYLVGHNISGYDLSLLHRLHDWGPVPGCTVIDTLVVSRLILPHLDDLDDQAAAMGAPALGKLRGRHSLEAWGARLGIPKVGADIEDWSKWTPELQQRCVGDVKICKALHRFLQPEGYSQQALELEHRVAPICNRITTDGVPFDVEAAERLRRQWTARRAELEEQLRQQFSGTNLNSRVQIGALLEARGWVPEKRTEKTKQPKIDDEVLEKLPAIYPEFTGLAEHQILGRRLGQLSNGKEAWLKHVGKDGRIHGAVVHIGTPHSRAAHFNPNLAQVPNPKRGKPLAVECRALFRHPGDWVFVACDQAGLQDRCFSHYLAQFDGGNYGRSYVAGADPHWAATIALELVSPNTERDKASKLHAALREGSKSFRYGFLFGMRGKRAGEIIATTIRAARAVDPSYRGPSTNGSQALQRFEAATPGLKQLRESLEAQAAQKQWVPGLDGRRVPTGAQYKALNRIVTSAEAIICKRWLINVYKELCARFRYGWNDGDIVITAWVHDELVCCCRPEIAKEVGEIMVRHAKEAGEFYDLKVSLDAVYTIGRSWAGDADTERDDDHVSASSTKIPDDLSIPEFLMRGPAAPATMIDSAAPATPDALAEILNAGDHDEAGEERIDDCNDQADDDDQDNDAGGNSGAGGNIEGDGYSSGERLKGSCSAVYIYRGANGAPYLRVVRTSAKQFPQYHWEGGRWLKRKPKGPKIPYRLPELISAAPDAPVFICEGEKDADNVAARGLIATTNSEGAGKGKWTVDLNKWFAGKLTAYILEDNDQDGRRHAREVASNLQHVVDEIRIVSFPELPVKGDVSDWLDDTNGTKEQLLARAKAAPRWQRDGYVLVRASDIVPRAMDWLWEGHILRGSQELLTGIPGNGKSQIHCAFIAYVTTGGAWPDGCNGAPAGNVIMLTAEDCLDQTIVPRLIAAGADRDRVFVLKKIRRDNKERMFLLSEDLEELERMIIATGDIRLITIDPITAYMGGKLDSHRATDVRGQLGPLADLAERMDVALSAITHPPKHTTQRAIDHFIGSQAFIAAARIGHMTIEEVSEDEQGNKLPTGRSLFTNPKNNVSRKMSTLAYRINEKPLVGGIKAACVTWDEIVDITADQAIAATIPARERGQQSDVMLFLMNILANGPVAMKTVQDKAAERGFSLDQLKRTKRRMGIVAFKQEGTLEGHWFWALAQHAPTKSGPE